MPAVGIVEVAPRDGLQNEARVLPTDAKVALVGRAVAAGARRIEVASFVDPRRVPQMADGEAVLAGVPRSPDVAYIGLVLNTRGYERAVAAGVDEINLVVVATDTFSRRNQGVDTDTSMRAAESLVARAHADGLSVSLTIAASFGCPFEGEVAVDRVVDIAARGAAAGVDEIALADTIGVAVPTDVTERVGAVGEVAAGIPLRLHLHDTRHTGIANAYAGVLAGVASLDASLGGIGGCPFAPAATGNIATEDLVYLLDRMGVEHGLDLGRLTASVPWLEEQLDVRAPGMLARSGPFPGATAPTGTVPATT